MAKILLRKRLDGSLAAMDEEAQETLKRVKLNADCWCELRVARNPKRHRLYMALIGQTYANLPESRAIHYPSVYVFRKAVEMHAGHKDELVELDGTVTPIPRSVAFAELDDIEFNILFPRVIQICADLLRMSSAELADEIERYAA